MRRILYGLIIGVLYLFSLLPLKVHYFLSDFIAFLLHKILRYRYSVIITNLSRSFPDYQYKEIARLAKEYYHYMSDIVVEAIWAFSASREKIAWLFSFTNPEVLNEAYGTGKNVIVMLAHHGNWEMFTGMPDLRKTYGHTMDNKDFHFVYKKMSSKVSDMVIYKMRSIHKACTLVESGTLWRHILKNKNENGVYYLIADQFPDTGQHFVVDFLHQKTAMIKGPEYISRKMGMPVLYFNIDRVKRGYYICTYTKVCDDASKTEEGFIMREFARLLEQDIIKNKSTWLWSHRRWKKL